MRVGIDVGGTFTDLVAFDAADGALVVGKALNDASDPVAGVTGALSTAGVDPTGVSEMIHGTTMVTNLLIERMGARVGLICSRGFRDLLEIQWSWRPRTFDLRYEKTPPLVPRELRLEVGGRISSDGEEQEPLDTEEIERTVRLLADRGVEALVVALYNSYASPEHELKVHKVARAVAPDLPVSLSTEVDRRIGEYPRVSTATLNAMAIPRVRSYATALEKVIRAPTYYMHSAGGMIPATEARSRPIYLAFSGPAAGVLAGREVAGELGFRNAITMDMGGTSCDVCLIWDGELQYREQVDVEWGIPARVRSLALHTVGAGGGSIAWRDPGGALKVGPMSAGASPGPACYGRGGGEPAVTDANLVLGILSASTGLIGGQFQLDAEAAHKALWGLGEHFGVSATDVAAGVYAVVNANMAQAIREITVRQGIDPRECVLVAFGGAGAQHAAGVAHELGIRRVVIPANGGVLSAAGLLMADLQVTSQETVLLPVEQLGTREVEESFAHLAADAMRRLEVDEAGLDLERSAGMRYVAQSHEVVVPVTGDPERARRDFEDEHERLFGTRLGDPVEVVDLYVTATVGGRVRPRPSALSAVGRSPASGEERRRLELVGHEVPVFRRGAVPPETRGPCLIEEANSVTLVPASGRVVAAEPHIVVELEAE
jgi:N-methylhydantoinase A